MGETIVLDKRGDLVTVTPMMQQYLDVKEQYEDFILMYRLGDFYECFFEDAIVASRVLELTLTGRDCGDGKRAAMCGVPFHKADVYVGRLVEQGYKVAICEQMEDPKSAVGLVKRDVIRVVTPGTITDSELLSEGKNNYLAAVSFGKENIGLAVADISTGEVAVTAFSGEEMLDRLENELGAYSPAEVLIDIPAASCPDFSAFVADKFHAMVTEGGKRLFSYDRAVGEVRSVFADEAGKLTLPEQIMTVGALIAYIRETQKSNVTFVKELNVYAKGQYLEFDQSTRRNLELVESMRSGEKRGTLLWILNKTHTSMGARLLRNWILKPSVDLSVITHRQSAVRDLVDNRRARDEIGALLSSMLDLERLTAKAVYGSANAKDLRAIAISLEKIPDIKAALSSFESRSLSRIGAELDPLDELCRDLLLGIVDNPPYTVREGGMIRKGFDVDVDYYRSVKENGAQIMSSIEEKEREATGIKTLKVDYNKVFGYYIEVTKSLVDQVPDRFVRKQTLTGCERYITQELKDMETAIFSSDEKLVSLEFEIFTRLREEVCENAARLRNVAALIAELDVLRSFAEVASKNNYVCPEVDFSTELTIRDGRHPVVEKFVTDSYFVPNDTVLDTDKNRLMIITGPNMAGKSTYMRQVALITVMAQIGSFVPAKEAHIGIVDKVFTRVGASDDLASGQSTFMLEMSEVAMILKNATARSLIVYDEVGRGTSTYDGMAIARAVVEYTNSKKIGARTLFATHYHELISMEEEFSGIVNYNIAAKKRGDGIVFLRKILRGGTDDSYGIEVAKIAGVPGEVVRRAREILSQIEAEGHVPPAAKQSAAQSGQEDFFTNILSSKENEVADRLREADLNTLTPIEAMNLLYALKSALE